MRMNGERLRLRREELEMSQDELARQLQLQGMAVTRSTISAWETGRNPSPLDSADDIRKLANVLKLDVSDILPGDDNLRPATEAARWAAMIVDRLPPEVQKTAVDQLRALERLAKAGN